MINMGHSSSSYLKDINIVQYSLPPIEIKNNLFRKQPVRNQVMNSIL